MTTVKPSSKPHSQFVEGLQFPAMFSTECIRSAIHYKARSDDFFLVTYPKCGTTWTKNILMLIQSHGKPIEDDISLVSGVPFLEMVGSETAEHTAHPRTFMTHLPFHLIPWNDSAKYLYVTRNPRDCCVSYFHHMRNIPGHAFNGTFDEFFELFISGEIDYGDYFDHLLGWYEHRIKPNVLFVTYEELKEHTKETILKIATFMDENLYSKPLKEDPEKLESVVKYSSFDYMKDKVNKSFESAFSMSEEERMKSKLPDQMKTFLAKNAKLATGSTPQFVRKGIVGDWMNHFSKEQVKRMNEKYLEKIEGTEIHKLWEKYL